MSSTLSESDSDAPPKAEASFALMTAIFTGFNGLEKESVRIFRGWDVSNVVEELWQMADDNPLDPDTTYNIEVVAAFADGKRFTITDDESPGVSTVNDSLESLKDNITFYVKKTQSQLPLAL